MGRARRGARRRNERRPKSGLTVWPSDSLCEMSVILAKRFGGTPWAWRGDPMPDERDWGTALSLLAMEQEELDKLERR